MDILSKEFDELREQFKNKLNKVNEAFNQMQQKYKDCENFFENISRPNNWCLNNNQQNEEQRLLNEYKDAIEKWEKANKEFNDFHKTYPGTHSCDS